MKLDAQKLAKEIYDAYMLRLSRATGRDAPTWSSLSGNERGAFREAIEDVVARQIELLALDMKLDDMMDDVLLEQPLAQAAKSRPIPMPEATLCYYCSKGVAIKWYACERCLKI